MHKKFEFLAFSNPATFIPKFSSVSGFWKLCFAWSLV